MFINADTWDSPTTIIAELAKKLGKPAHTFTGGKWQDVTTTKGSTLQSHIRVPAAIANLATQHGFRGVFTMIPSKSSSPSGVAWVKRHEDSFEEYFRTVLAVAEDQGKPLAIRQHGLSGLGIVGGEITWDSPDKPKTFVMHGVPAAWDQHDVAHLPHQQRWTQTVPPATLLRTVSGAILMWIAALRSPPKLLGNVRS